MNAKSQSMRFVMGVMTEVMETRKQRQAVDEDMSMDIDPDAPLIVQVGDYGYEVQSAGGDFAHAGFVLMCKPDPVCKWEGLECIMLKDK